MKSLAMVALPLLVVLLINGATQTMAVSCDPTQLVACLNPIVKGTPPPSRCCKKLKEQKPCLCRYVKDPSFGKFVNSPNARKVAATCKVPFPKCKS
ncbi:hypothetical protein Lser_V15G07326 [Lactuca serriola]